MCWLTKTFRPRASATVFFRCAPTARIGASAPCRAATGAARSRARGAARARGPSTTRDDRVVDVPDDRAVVDEEEVGDAAEPRERLALVDADRLVGEVAARRDDREAELAHQQMMQRRIRQHHAEVAGCPARRMPPLIHDASPRARRSSTIGRLRREQAAAPRAARRRTRASNGLQRRGHQRERLLLAVLSRAQPLARPRRCAASTIRWKPPSPLTATISPVAIARAAAQRAHRPIAASRLSVAVPQLQCRARTPGRRSAGRGSGGRAGSSYSARHSGHIAKPFIDVFGAVVGQRFDDAEARPAVRAVGERIAVAAVGRVEDLREAIGQVAMSGRTSAAWSPRLARCADLEAREAAGVEPRTARGSGSRTRRRLSVSSRRQEVVEDRASRPRPR